MDRQLPGGGSHAHRNPESESRLQQRLWLLPGSHESTSRQGAGRVPSPADSEKCRALRHARVEGVRRESSHSRRQAKQLEYEPVPRAARRHGGRARRLRATAEVLAELDCLAAFAELARHGGYCRPALVAEPSLQIVAGRHPVLDRQLPQGSLCPTTSRWAPRRGWCC